MKVQPRYDPLASSDFFEDGRSARPVVPGTIARGQLRADTKFYRGTENGEPVSTIPVPVTRQLLELGRERYNIFCSPCHGLLGDGQGMVVQRGFRQPPSFHIDRLREVPIGHFFVVETNGFGVMASYASRVRPEERWAIAGYIRALQLSQAAKLTDLPAEERERLLKRER
jgi:mono/diheme cytochrome c family protein